MRGVSKKDFIFDEFEFSFFFFLRRQITRDTFSLLGNDRYGKFVNSSSFLFFFFSSLQITFCRGNKFEWTNEARESSKNEKNRRSDNEIRRRCWKRVELIILREEKKKKKNERREGKQLFVECFTYHQPTLISIFFLFKRILLSRIGIKTFRIIVSNHPPPVSKQIIPVETKGSKEREPPRIPLQRRA